MIFESDWFIIFGVVFGIYSVIYTTVMAAYTRRDLKRAGSSDWLLDVLSWPARKVLRHD